MNAKYSEMLDRLVPDWKSKASLIIIGEPLEWILELEANQKEPRS